ncbi:hypothetical protein PHMEG_00034820 [Phytophthora megakarya]|uniref:HAT C-terminal dimerisation domain-containing protein n=1 Tax=Phytophthora megakarya TaxID=4795 RepID=A0A225USR4_9STRA|nr:hypothetical protein PHMEG_00034820 [Phytophthora megakarya]
MDTCSYAFEMQLLLHPNFQNPDGSLKKVIQRSNLQAKGLQQVADRHYTKVRRNVIDGVRKIMDAVDTHLTSPGIVAPPPDVVFSEDIMELFAETADEVVPPPAETRIAMHTQRVDEELDRWLTTPSSLQAGNFRLRPLVVRVLFSMPSSSAQIERDFGTAGRMVTPQRSSLAPYSCPKLSPNSAEERLPSHVLVNIVQDLDDEFGSLANLFSSESMNLGLSDNEDVGEE